MHVPLSRLVGAPKIRSECDFVPRPCPHIFCKWHLITDCDVFDEWSRAVIEALKEDGALWRWFCRKSSGQKRRLYIMTMPDDLVAECLESLRESCALDVSESGPRTLEQISELLDVAPETVRNIETRALEKLKNPDVTEWPDGMSDEEEGEL